MEIKVGQKLKTGEIVWVSEDKRVFGVYHPDDLGNKGRIWGKCHFQKLSADERQDFWNMGMPVREFAGVWYILLESPADYPEIFTRCNHLVTDAASAFAHPEPLVFET